MADFKFYQQWRADAEKKARDAVLSWAIAEAPGEMTMAHVKSLETTVVWMINQYSREAYDLGVAPNPKKEGL